MSYRIRLHAGPGFGEGTGRQRASSTPERNAMAQSSPPRRSPAVWVTATVMIVVAIALPLVVPIYARTNPKWGAFPFFYWYLLVLVPVIAILCGSTYLLLRTKPAPSAGVSGGNGEVAR